MRGGQIPCLHHYRVPHESIFFNESLASQLIDIARYNLLFDQLKEKCT
jgi:hypothetical protein